MERYKKQKKKKEMKRGRSTSIRQRCTILLLHVGGSSSKHFFLSRRVSGARRIRRKKRGKGGSSVKVQKEQKQKTCWPPWTKNRYRCSPSEASQLRTRRLEWQLCELKWRARTQSLIVPLCVCVCCVFSPAALTHQKTQTWRFAEAQRTRCRELAYDVFSFLKCTFVF